MFSKFDPVRLRSEMKAKAKRMAGGDPSKKVDASTWKPGALMHTEVPTGEMPLPRKFKRGGAVSGSAPASNPGRAARAKGGRIGKDIGGGVDPRQAAMAALANAATKTGVQPNRMGFNPTARSPLIGLKRGGKANRKHRENGGEADSRYDTLMDKAYASDMARNLGRREPEEMTKDTSRLGSAMAKSLGSREADEILKASGTTKKNGGKVAKADGGSANYKGGSNYLGGTRPTGGRIARAKGGRAKGKTNIIISVGAPQGAGAQAGMPLPSPPMRPPAQPIPVPAPPMGAAPPPPMPMGMPMPPPGGPPMLPRKSGGRTVKRAGGGDVLADEVNKASRETGRQYLPTRPGGAEFESDRVARMDRAGRAAYEANAEDADANERARKRKSGGRAVYPTIAGAKSASSFKDMDAGACSAMGRLEKTAIAKKKYALAP